MITSENLWEIIIAHQGETFYTAKGLPFTYTIKGGEFFTDRKKKSITKATFEKAFLKIQEDTSHKITGPKALNVFGAPYVFAMFRQLGVIEDMP
ncbi:MAG: hypothetical protein HFG53_12630 [Lachnospiraceae bacterium]|jgi:hypothetical protein|nr:hypothetical protein [Lachnospiraceae bacterium]